MIMRLLTLIAVLEETNNMEDAKDYGNSGLTIRSALIDQFKRYPDKDTRPRHLIWNGLRILTADAIPVPKQGIIKGEILSVTTPIEQGFDMDTDGGLQIEDGRWIHPLRTWNDPKLQSVVQYPFRSNNCLLWVWNVYKMTYAGGQVIEEKWTENAGMWVEELSPMERVYHCSHGMANPPDFTCLVFKITVSSRS